MKGTEVRLGPFTGGINQVAAETDIPENALREAADVDITSSGNIKKRSGYTKLKTLTNSHSLFSNKTITLLVDNGYLCRLLDDNDTLVQLAQVAGAVAYAEVAGVIYWSDGISLGRVNWNGEALDAWVPNPGGMPTLSSTAGNFQPGIYQVAITYIDFGGLESGADQAAVIELTAVGGIHLTDIPQSDAAAYVRVYVTTPNGTELQRHSDISMGTTEFYINTPFLGRALETQFAEPMVAGPVLCAHDGRLYAASGNTLVYSEALLPGLTRIMDNYFQFPSSIKIVLSHATGLYVVADKTYFLPGGDPESMSLRVAYPHSGVFGTGLLVSASMFGLEVAGEIPYFFSDTGPVVCVGDGMVVPLTEKSLAPPSYETGAALFREEDGVRSMITSVQSAGAESKLGSQDAVEFEVRRNGITV